MKSKEIDIDDFDFSDEAAFNRRFRRIPGEERVELKARIDRARGSEVEIQEIKEELLKDKRFLQRLKTALAAL